MRQQWLDENNFRKIFSLLSTLSSIKYLKNMICFVSRTLTFPGNFSKTVTNDTLYVTCDIFLGFQVWSLKLEGPVHQVFPEEAGSGEPQAQETASQCEH